MPNETILFFIVPQTHSLSNEQYVCQVCRYPFWEEQHPPFHLFKENYAGSKFFAMFTGDT